MKVPSHSIAAARARRQGGAVAIIFGLTVVVLIGFAGLAIDLGRFFVIKAELQNAMDACALAAASQLRPGQNDSNALIRAVAYGSVFSTDDAANTDGFKNKADFQNQHTKLSILKILFSPELKDSGSNYLAAASADPNTARYAKCEYPLSGLPIYLMKVLNLMPGMNIPSTQTVSAMAVATLGNKLCNVIPVAICGKSDLSTDNPPYLLKEGDWITVGKKEGGGWFDWVDFEFQGGGSPDIWAGLTNPGECEFPDAFKIITEQGVKSSAKDRWNTRFGIYANTNLYDSESAPPDQTGYSYFNHKNKIDQPYSWINWGRDYDFINDALTPRAYPHHQNPAQTTYLSYFDSFSVEPPPDIFPGADPEILNSGQLVGGRDDRRLVVVPIMTKCDDAQERKVTDLACVLMLNPFGKVAGQNGGDINGQLEYIGLAKGSLCGGNEAGPRTSVLVK